MGGTIPRELRPRVPSPERRGSVPVAVTSSRVQPCLLVAALSVACSRTCENKPPPVEEPQRTVTADSDSTLEIVSEGAEPRHRLEVGRWAGLRYRLELSVDASLGIVGHPPLRAPTHVLVSSVEVLRGMADPVLREHGGRERRFVEERIVVVDARAESEELAPDALAGVNGALVGLRGLVIRQLVGEDGEVASLETELVGGKPPTPEVKRLLDTTMDSQRRFPFRLPHKPVGVGAKWRFRESITLQNVRLWQVSEMTFSRLTADRVTIALRVRHEAPRQEVPHPLDPAHTATVEQYRGDGSGELVMDRLSAVLIAGRLQTTGSLRLSWEHEGQAHSAMLVAASTTRLRGQVGDPPADAGPAATEGGDSSP